jgi:cyclopropane fatty-acyl-phospholipid synthase-like methyltransferase
MGGKDLETINQKHLGGNPEFWKDEIVKNYDYQQSIVSEAKEEALQGIVRIVRYFLSYHRRTVQPLLLDIGCGPGALSTRILEAMPESIVTGVDASSQMADAANRNLKPKYGNRFQCIISNFNFQHFWLTEIDKEYDSIVSAGALHYLSDERRRDFLVECHHHLKEDGVFVAKIATCSDCKEFAEMQKLFRVEYAYQQLSEVRDVGQFDEFRLRFESVDKEADINWKSYHVYIDDLLQAGYKRVDLVRQHWLTSTFLAVK